MDVRNSLDGLKSLLGVNPTAPSAPQGKGSTTGSPGSFETDRATFSSAASEVSQAALGEGVRADKVAAVQAALAAGTYSVPASAVASRVIDSMLTAGMAADQS
ncbi:MAG TPA: flagellar biosynthesis anti-sigma factor FlgM [Terracidiphilus sp.]|nr:flagellar biosynthesis anti-sigma factor FlgM [Terracidiphilus sp.]